MYQHFVMFSLFMLILFRYLFKKNYIESFAKYDNFIVIFCLKNSISSGKRGNSIIMITNLKRYMYSFTQIHLNVTIYQIGFLYVVKLCARLDGSFNDAQLEMNFHFKNPSHIHISQNEIGKISFECLVCLVNIQSQRVGGIFCPVSY